MNISFTDAKSSGKDISLRNVTVTYGGLELLKGSTLKLTYNTKYALIGPNGIGKSTLMNALTQISSINTFLIKQEFTSDQTPLQLVATSNVDQQKLLQRIEETQDADTLAKLYDELSLYQDNANNLKAFKILKDIGFSDALMNTPFESLSGGWRMKAMLCCGVFNQPHLLLLDEPTNHLDLTSIKWLTNYLKSIECTVIVVSHDHDFLNSYSECIIHFSQKQLNYYPGNYNEFVDMRNEKLNQTGNRDRKKQNASDYELKRLQLPRITKMPKKRAFDKAWVWGGESLLESDTVDDSKQLKLKFPLPDSSVADPLIQITELSFGYSAVSVLWKNLTLSITKGTRICVMGKNGLGKSSLLKCIVGEEKPLFGSIFKHHNLRIAYFSQHFIQSVDYSQTPVDAIATRYPGEMKTQEIRAYLASFGLRGNNQLKKLELLSGGQKVRFAFALLLANYPHVLLLDEPTSHLDMEMTESLVEALEEWEGAVVVVSHHVWFVREFLKQRNEREKSRKECYVVKKKMFVKVDFDQYVAT